MRLGCVHVSQSRATRIALPAFAAMALFVTLPTTPAGAAEFGTGPWVKGATDIFSGVVPSVPGVYVRTDAYHYSGDAETTIFNGIVAVGIDQTLTATIPTVTYVTPWKLFGGTYAMAVIPSVMTSDVNVALGLPAFTGPRGRTFGPFTIERGDTNLAFGDTAFTPFMLGWNSGNLHWNVAVFGFAPTGDYSTRQLANTSLNRWAIMPRFGATWFDPKSGWQIDGAAIYTFNFENPDTNYQSGEILNLEGAIVKNFGRFGVGAVGYAMIQTTGDSGAGARLGDFESRVYGAGPILTYAMGDPANPLTIIVKYFKEFDARNTFEGEVFDAAVSFKF